MSESHGTDITQHRQMWHTFTRIILWSLVGILAVLVLLALTLL